MLKLIDLKFLKYNMEWLKNKVENSKVAECDDIVSFYVCKELR